MNKNHFELPLEKGNWKAEQGKGVIKLSPSKLALFRECPYCFYLSEKYKIMRPRGFFPSLPGGMDSVIKEYFDRYRDNKALPPELEGIANGKLVDQETIAFMRNRHKFCFEQEIKNTKIIFSGAIDECIVEETKKGNRYSPIDFKTRSSFDETKVSPFHQLQLDCYALQFKKTGYTPSDYAYLIYYTPKQKKKKDIFSFDVNIVKVKTDPDNAFKTLEEAIICLQNDQPPKSSQQCEFCHYLENFLKFKGLQE